MSMSGSVRRVFDGTKAAKGAYERLHRMITEGQMGTIRKMEKALGQYPDWWRKIPTRKTGISLAEFVSVARYIGADAGAIIRQAIETTLLQPPSTPEPAPAPASVAASPVPILGQEVDVDTGVDEAAERARLFDLDDSRYLDPERVIVELTRRYHRVPPPLRSLALGVVGSSYRLLHALPEAEACLARALDLSDRHSAAGIYQRLVYVKKSNQPEQCVGLANQAVALHLRNGDLAGIGSSLIDLAIAYKVQGAHGQAVEVYKDAQTGYFPHLKLRSKVGLLQGLAESLHASGALAEAKTAFHAAQEVMQQAQPQGKSFQAMAAHATWLKARLYDDQECYFAAAQALLPFDLFGAVSCALEGHRLDPRTASARAAFGLLLGRCNVPDRASLEFVQDLFSLVRLGRPIKYENAAAKLTRLRTASLRARLGRLNAFLSVGIKTCVPS